MIVHRVRRRLGFRGLALVMFGSMWVSIGISVPFNPDRIPGLIHTYLPVWFRTGIWVGTGLLAILGALRPGLGEKHWPGRTERPPVAEIIGFGALAFAPTELVLSFAWALIAHPKLSWLIGFEMWLVFDLFVFLLSRWPEPAYPEDLAAVRHG